MFQRFPRDFFDLVIIDECHRSGFGTWREILDHFESAIHLGMTATPKQDESLEVTIADEATFLVEATGEQLSLDQYLDYTRRKVVGYVPEWARLWEVWGEPEKRRAFLDDLRRASIHVEVLAEVLGQLEADQFDLLAHIAYGRCALAASGPGLSRPARGRSSAATTMRPAR